MFKFQGWSQIDGGELPCFQLGRKKKNIVKGANLDLAPERFPLPGCRGGQIQLRAAGMER